MISVVYLIKVQRYNKVIGEQNKSKFFYDEVVAWSFRLIVFDVLYSINSFVSIDDMWNLWLMTLND